MKKYFLIFCICNFANFNFANGAYFYADAVESAIQKTFPSELQSVVAAEYESQMDASGNIDTAGMEQVCYAGNYDVSTTQGATACANFVNTVADSCVYATGSGLKLYTNPQSEDDEIRKCIFDKTIDYVFAYEKGFQRTPSDPGNRICDKYGKPLKDENGNYILGATNMGITTCSSGLSVACIKNMTPQQARQYYWTRFYYKYRYYKLPIEVQAAVMELAVGGTGLVSAELRAAANIRNCGTESVINDCTAAAVTEYIEHHGVERFYQEIGNLRAQKRSGKAKERALGIQSLADLYITCGGQKRIFVTPNEATHSK